MFPQIGFPPTLTRATAWSPHWRYTWWSFAPKLKNSLEHFGSISNEVRHLPDFDHSRVPHMKVMVNTLTNQHQKATLLMKQSHRNKLASRINQIPSKTYLLFLEEIIESNVSTSLRPRDQQKYSALVWHPYRVCHPNPQLPSRTNSCSSLPGTLAISMIRLSHALAEPTRQGWWRQSSRNAVQTVQCLQLY